MNEYIYKGWAIAVFKRDNGYIACFRGANYTWASKPFLREEMAIKEAQKEIDSVLDS